MMPPGALQFRHVTVTSVITFVVEHASGIILGFQVRSHANAVTIELVDSSPSKMHWIAMCHFWHEQICSAAYDRQLTAIVCTFWAPCVIVMI